MCQETQLVTTISRNYNSTFWSSSHYFLFFKRDDMFKKETRHLLIEVERADGCDLPPPRRVASYIPVACREKNNTGEDSKDARKPPFFTKTEICLFGPLKRALSRTEADWLRVASGGNVLL